MFLIRLDVRKALPVRNSRCNITEYMDQQERPFNLAGCTLKSGVKTLIGEWCMGLGIFLQKLLSWGIGKDGWKSSGVRVSVMKSVNSNFLFGRMCGKWFQGWRLIEQLRGGVGVKGNWLEIRLFLSDGNLIDSDKIHQLTGEKHATVITYPSSRTSLDLSKSFK